MIKQFYIVLCFFGLMLYVQVNNYGHEGTVSSPNHTFFLDHSSPLADSRRVVISYKRKYVHKVLVNRSVKLAQEKSVVGELTVPT